MKLNKEELLIGAIVGGLSALKVGWIALAIAPVTSFFWAYTGAGASKLYRRLGVPLVIASACAVVTHSWVPFISVPLAFAVLSIGYGIPSTQPPDAGSWLGRIAFKLAKSNEKKADLYCRGLIYALLTLAFLPCLVANGN